MNGLLVTGTDTGAGKTLVTAALAAAFAARGRDVGVAKPVETGCRAAGDAARGAQTGAPGALAGADLHPEDAATLRAAAASAESLGGICPYRFADPLAPALAAARAGAAVELDVLVARLRARAAAHDLFLVEGAGGLLAPLGRGASWADLARALALPVLLVVGSRLGAVNHALLSLEALAARGLTVRGYVLSRLTPAGDLATETNGALLRELTPVACLGELPWITGAAELLRALREGSPDTAREARARLAALAGAHLDLDALAAR